MTSAGLVWTRAARRDETWVAYGDDRSFYSVKQVNLPPVGLIWDAAVRHRDGSDCACFHSVTAAKQWCEDFERGSR
jgi:hypothetical protein